MSDELDKRLARYLDEVEDEKSKGYTTEKLHLEVQAVRNGLTQHAADDAVRFDAFQTEFRSIRMRTETLESETTKLKDEQFEFKREVTTELKELKKDAKDTSRSVERLEDEVTGSHNIPPMPEVKRDSFGIKLNSKGVGWIIKSFAIALAGGLGALIKVLVDTIHGK